MKKQPKEERMTRRRQKLWSDAADGLVLAKLPFTVALNIAWSACFAAEQRCGHWLGLPEAERVNRLWDRLRRLVQQYGSERFLAARAPEYDRTRGVHLHMALHLPEEARHGLIHLLELATGARAKALYLPDGTDMRQNGRRLKGVIAIGEAESWMVQKNTRPLSGGEHGILGYLTKAPRADQVCAQFRISNDLVALARQVRARRQTSPA